MSLVHLTGLQPLPAGYAEVVHGSQMRAADRMFGFCMALVGICVLLIDFRLLGQVPVWMLAIWTGSILAAYVPSFRLRRAAMTADYAKVSRDVLLKHGALAFVQGLAWVAAMILFTSHGRAPEVAILWTIACCLMAAVAIAYQPTPLSAGAFIVTVGGGGIWMMLNHADPLFSGIVATYTLLLVGACLRQAHLFGVQLVTNKLLAEKSEVVSLLLKEHDVEAADALWQTDVARRLTGVSPSFARMLGRNADQLEGHSILEVLAGPDWEAGQFDPALHQLAERLKQRVPFSNLVLPVIVNDQPRWWDISASPRLDEKGAFLGFRGVGSDITVQKLSSERIAQMARYDMLTNLPNRLHLTEELTATIEETARWKTRCGFMMIDLDRFKAVNDTLGHLVGDQLLAQVAERIGSICTTNEVCGRLGGDEFAVIIRDVRDLLYVDQLALALIDAVSKPYVVDNNTLLIGASIGSATSPQDGGDADTLIRCADLAMYRAKEAGRGKHLRYALTMHAEAEERRILEEALRDALGKDEIHLLFQPIVNIAQGTVTGFEALARWTHPKFGAMMPEQFIPIAEDTKLIGAIGEWVLRTACREAANWPEDVRVSVNVSSEQLYDPEFLETVVSALAHGGIAASRLELEVTEAAFLQEGTGVSQLLDRLKALGVSLVLDDFGTGYSSLSYLSRSPFNSIKIDRSFVASAARNQRESLAIIKAVVAMAQSLDIETTAEGVETDVEFDLLRTLGCTKTQGFYFCRPMLAADARALFGELDSQVA